MGYKLVTDKLLKCLQDIVGSIKCSLGQPNGIATLDSTGKIPNSQLSGGTLASGTITNAATVDIDLSAFYAQYNVIKIYIYNLRPVTTGADLWLQVSADGVNYDHGAANYAYIDGYHNVSSAGSVSIGADTKIVLLTGINNSSSASLVGEITLFNPSVATINPNIKFDVYYTQLVQTNGGGTRLANQVTKGIRLLMSAGNINASYSVVAVG